MKPTRFPALAFVALLATSSAEPAKEKPAPEGKATEAEKVTALNTHREGSEKAAIDQDKQAANASELIDEQTNQKVIDLLNQVESLMGETTDRLEDGNTGGDTIAIQTEIIEKIYEAAKQKAQSPSEGSSPEGQQSMGAMLEMMEQMMGKGKEAKDKPSQQGGPDEKKADSDSTNEASSGPSNTQKGERRVPRAAGKSGTNLPPEFQKALEGYNKAQKNK
ncbi:hypothetical protein V2O64_00245 [Verrucomicrobiaceae bacterium 227]